jgi:hypothetical protein
LAKPKTDSPSPQPDLLLARSAEHSAATRTAIEQARQEIRAAVQELAMLRSPLH